MTTWLLGAAFGAFLWTFLEYVLHRFVFHKRALGKLAAKEHLMHHAKVDYFAHWSMKIALAVPVLSAIAVLASLVLGVALGTSVPIGVLAGYGIYEVIHRRIHVRAPRGAYGRWARRHHLLHHFGRSDMNHGVTTPLWDVVFGTLAPLETIKVPRQHAPKFPWLFDGAASVAPEFSSEYRIV